MKALQLKTLSSIKKVPLNRPCGLTIGSFDGIHLGHQALIQHLRHKISDQGTLIVFTFSNHPSQILSSRPPTPTLLTLDHKLKLLQELGVDLTLLMEFSLEFSTVPFDYFLTQLKSHFPFSHLVLGEGATFGKDKQGDEAHVMTSATKLDFEAEYVPKLLFDHTPISSGKIRSLVQQGLFSQVGALLGRPYSIYSPFVQERGNLKFSLPTLCLPPNGCYPIELIFYEKHHFGNALVDQKNGTIQVDVHINNPSIGDRNHPAELIFS